jgi:hypothetical protein
MQTVSIQIPYYRHEILKANKELDNLYDWLSNSPNGTDEDLDGLDMAIHIMGKILFQIEADD